MSLSPANIAQLIVITVGISLCVPQVAVAGRTATREHRVDRVDRAGKAKVSRSKGKTRARPKRFRRLRRSLRGLKKRLRIPPKVKRKIRRGVKIAKGYGTLTADKIQASLPRRLSKGFARVRLAAPTNLGGFAGHKFKQDKLFLGSFGVAYPVATHMQIPAFVYLGMDPVTALVVHEVAEIPMSLGLLAWRQHHIRKDRSQGFGGTLKKLGKEYGEYAKKQQKSSRRFIKGYRRQRKQNKLRAMSEGLRRPALATTR